MSARSDAGALAKLGRLVAGMRLERGLTQEALAEAAGFTARFLQELEYGRGNPSYLKLLALARALDVSLPEFLARVENKTERP